MNYYEDILLKIKDNIKKNEYTRANKLILDELNMPYIPLKYNKMFEELKDQVRDLLNHSKEYKKKERTNFDKTTIFEIINKYDDVLTPIALIQMQDLNLRDCIEQIKEIFINKEIKNPVKILILEYMNNQQINIQVNIKTKYDDISVDVSKNVIFTTDFKILIEKIEEKLYKDPSLLNICRSYINQYLVNIFPVIYTYTLNDELIFIDIAKKSMNINSLLPENCSKKSLFINNIIKRYI